MRNASTLKLTACAVIVGATLGGAAPGVSAQGIFDRAKRAIEEAKKKAEEAKRQAEEAKKAAEAVRQLKGQTGAAVSGLGATAASNDFATCMAQTVGHQEKLTAEVLQQKLDQSPNLSAEDRRKRRAHGVLRPYEGSHGEGDRGRARSQVQDGARAHPATAPTVG